MNLSTEKLSSYETALCFMTFGDKNKYYNNEQTEQVLLRRNVKIQANRLLECV